MEKNNLLLEKISNWVENQTAENANELLDFVLQVKQNSEFDKISRSAWLVFLDKTHRPEFLQAISTLSKRTDWAELVFKILQHTNYTLLDMVEQRTAEHPDKILFQNMAKNPPEKWTYKQAYNHIREIAAVFFKTQAEPRVAIFSQNSPSSALTDIACLTHDIFNTPLNTHFNKETILYIFNELKINIAVADTKERLKLLQEIKEKAETPFKIFTTKAENRIKGEISFLQKKCKEISAEKINKVIQNRKRFQNNQVATTMFTSGSTGVPKGVSFSIYNLVSKRFARGAALPLVGKNETMLSFLPLFHTFGRYLEMLGTIYWHGTYVFVGNTSRETLLHLFPKINPSIFISIPLRWQNLYEAAMKTQTDETQPITRSDVEKVTGKNLKWGLSAAGYLAPKVFKFFEKNEVLLGSGFGMTEATGGITMTLPGEYKENSVGIPLPGVYTRLKENGELEISGHYIAKYLEDSQPYQTIPYPISADEDYWLSTGDIFTIDDEQHHEIIDRVKDIYKNNKGQTIAPRIVEQKFNRVPGIKNVFLVGDGKPYNVLLIVPNYNDTILKSTKDQNEYFHQIVMAANKDVAPYERVVNFTVLDRDFTQDKGELTPKGSFNRKKIEANFVEEIKKLYISNSITFDFEDFKISVPRWFYRDLSILETDIELTAVGLYNKRSNQYLTIQKYDENSIIVGDFIYTFSEKIVDLGTITRQPKLWLGNLQVIDFCPVKEGWDISLRKINLLAKVPFEKETIYSEDEIVTLKRIKPALAEVNKNIILALFSDEKNSRKAIETLGELFSKHEKRICEVLRLRLQAMAYSPYESCRSTAYRILLLDDPNPTYQEAFPTFLESGKSFLNEISIDKIAAGNIGKQQLQALRQRLYTYRTFLDWNITKVQQMQFEHVLKLLYNFTRKNFEYLPAVRSELSSWAVLDKNERLSNLAQFYVSRLFDNFSEFISEGSREIYEETWDRLIVFGTGVSDTEKNRILSVFKTTYFFQKSVILAFEEPNFDIQKIKDKGIWIVKLLALKDFYHYRISINTTDHNHYDLHMVVSRDENTKLQIETLYWMASISGYSFGPRAVPALGCSNANLGVLTTQYIGGLTVWDKVREFSDTHKSAAIPKKESDWRKLFIKGMSVFFRSWKISEYQIVPGLISPNNVVVPELDFQRNTMIVTLTNWSRYESPLSLIEPMVVEFYCKTAALYPWSEKLTKFEWIFDACVEAIGIDEAKQFFAELKIDIAKNPTSYAAENNILQDLEKFEQKIEKHFYFPLSMYNAISQYKEWRKINPVATSEAREQTISELMELYRLDQYPEIVRYKFYKNTYFKDENSEILSTFETLISKMGSSPDALPLQFVELSELQSYFDDGDKKEVFNKMVFPAIKSKQIFKLQKIDRKIGETVLLKSEIEDKTGKKYILRDPIEASEVGQLYQLFYKENYPKQISNADKHLVLTDSFDRIIGGLSYRELESNIALLDGLVVTSKLQGQRLGSAMIEDFFTRMSSKGVKVIKAHFLFGNYYLKHNFKVDKKWGALVRFL